MNPLIAFLKPTASEIQKQVVELPVEEPKPVPKADATYDEVVKKLYKLGISGMPQPSPDTHAWTSHEEQFNVLKVIELLIRRRKQVLAEVTHKAENRIEPLTSRTKGQLELYEQLKRSSREMTDKISDAEQHLVALQEQREALKAEQKAENDELDRQIMELQKRRK